MDQIDDVFKTKSITQSSRQPDPYFHQNEQAWISYKLHVTIHK